MLYKRQKFLLSFLNIFGGELSRTNCQKLVFLYSQYNNKDYYDFFPYKFGPFSNTLFDDKRSLSNKGILHESENFLVNYDHFSSDNCIDFRERMLITQFKDSVEGIRGQKLIEKTYKEFPSYAVNSELEIRTNKDCQNQTGTLFSLGYEGISIDKYLDILIKNNIDLLIDVRNNPISRKYGFSKTRLSKYCNSVNIEYIHLPELGIPSTYRKKINSKDDLAKMFNFYKTAILELNIDSVRKIITLVQERHSVVLLCFESDYKLCHRNLISNKIFNMTGLRTINL